MSVSGKSAFETGPSAADSTAGEMLADSWGKLIEDIESAHAGNLELDVRIATYLTGDPTPMLGNWGLYTTLMDKAIELVPRGCCGSVLWDLETGIWEASVSLNAGNFLGGAETVVFGRSKTGALAICAAALRANPTRDIERNPAR